MTMKITALYVYPIKGLRGIELTSAHIGPLGVSHDRTFMLYEVHPSTGELKKMQLDSHPRCALFEQRIVQEPQDGESAVVVRYHPSQTEDTAADEDGGSLSVPLQPDLSSLEKTDVVLHDSPAAAYRMGDSYDAWFSERFDVRAMLVYLGDGRRTVLGRTLLPNAVKEQQQNQQQGGWFSSITSYITGSQGLDQSSTPSLAFSDVAPLMVASEASLRDVRERLLEGEPVEMFKFRPNIVVDGEREDAWAEDFWAELAIVPNHGGEQSVLQVTGNCVRCTSLNVDYKTGKPGEGVLGQVLKRLMKDRRVDPGSKWSPVFGRYAFLDGRHTRGITVSVGDGVEITRRNSERTVWDWPGL